eukprot:NODE_314_length_1677_cov_339.498767.p1 GENE.NODE_314_length_1677_cov_339.498767~~NODE_314_length_1677_cov_339.498767.p1  ORF type:complete len:494 (-),score=148.43 NODE_314_length_1677_cov_339.498767:178-1659(-)
MGAQGSAASQAQVRCASPTTPPYTLFRKMIGSLRHQVRPRLSRGFAQVLAEPMAWNQAPVIVSKLPNGVRVTTKETFSDVVTAGVFVDGGVRAETPKTRGASQILERLAKTGTSSKSAAQLEAEVMSVGGQLSVVSCREHSSYTITVGKGDLTHGAGIVSDFVKEPAMENLPAHLAGFLRALDAKEQPTRAVIDDRLHMCAYRDSGLGNSLVGPFENMEQDAVVNTMAYHEQTHAADNLVFAVAGQVTHEEARTIASNTLGDVARHSQGPAAEKPYFCGAELIYRNDEMGPTAYMSVGWEAAPARGSDAVAFMIMASLIGKYKKNTGLVPGTVSGNRTINAIANKMGVGCADEFEGFYKGYKDTGIFGFYAACDEVAVEHCIGELMFHVNLMSHSVTDEEVERAKRELKIELFGGCDSSATTCGEVGTQVLKYGRGLPTAEMLLRIDAIDAQEIQRVAWTHLNDREISVTGLGPLHGLPPYFDLRRATHMHRY